MSTNDTKAFEDVYDVINPPPFNPKLFGTLIKEQAVLLLLAIYAKKSPTQFTETFLFPIVLAISLKSKLRIVFKVAFRLHPHVV